MFLAEDNVEYFSSIIFIIFKDLFLYDVIHGLCKMDE